LGRLANSESVEIDFCIENDARPFAKPS